MELSRRLLAVAGLVTEGASVADIGTDHGYIPIYLVRYGISPRVTAMDINPGPLDRARLHIQGQDIKVADKISTRQSDGLAELLPGEVQCAVLAGMGGGLVIRILEAGWETVKSLDSIILQPQSEMNRVRKYLKSKGLRVVKEDMVEEEGKYYPMMKAVHGDTDPYTKAEYQYGKLLLREKHPVLKEYLLREKRIKEEISSRLKAENSQRADQRLTELEQEIRLVEEALASYSL